MTINIEPEEKAEIGGKTNVEDLIVCCSFLSMFSLIGCSAIDITSLYLKFPVSYILSLL